MSKGIEVVQKIEMIHYKSLIPYANNARINDNAVPTVKASILKFGFNVPVVLETNSNTLVCGHTRIKAVAKLNEEGYDIKYVPCVRVGNLTEEQIKAYRLADNKVSEVALWDYEKLEKEMSEISSSIKMTDFGFPENTSPDLSKFFEPSQEPTAGKQEPEPEPQQSSQSLFKRVHKCPNCGEEFED